MTKQTESKLSKAQSTALTTAILNEWRVHMREYSEQSNWKNAQLRDDTSKATFKALAKRDMVTIIENCAKAGYKLVSTVKFTDAGRKVAIDLLHKSAVEEMDSDLKYRDMETKRKQAGADVAVKIIERYDVGTVEVTADYRLRDNMTLCYAVGFPQERTERFCSSLVRIDWSQDEYTIGTTGTHLTPKDAKRMGELMLIAVQVIESGILS